METLGTLRKAEASRLRVDEVPIQPVFDRKAISPADDGYIPLTSSEKVTAGRGLVVVGGVVVVVVGAAVAVVVGGSLNP